MLFLLSTTGNFKCSTSFFWSVAVRDALPCTLTAFMFPRKTNFALGGRGDVSHALGNGFRAKYCSSFRKYKYCALSS